MHQRNLRLTSALLLSAALTFSLSACGPEEENGSGNKPGNSASEGQGSSGQGGTTGSSGGDGKENGGDGAGEGDVFDNSKPVALPLPRGAEVTSVVSEGKTLVMAFAAVGGSADDAATAYEQKLQKNGYESPTATFSRGKQKVDVGREPDSVEVTLTYPDQAPPLPDAPVQKISSSADDTLKLTFGLDGESSDSVSMVKSYVGELANQGWETPTDGGTSATKGPATIQFDSSDPDLVTLTVDVPSSTD